MGIAADYVESEDLLVVVWHGAVSLDEWERAARAHLADESGWRNGRRRLIDLTTCNPSGLDTADVKHIIDLTREQIANEVGRRQAIVAAHAWELASDFARRSTELGATTIVFDRLATACTWLGTEAASIGPVLTSLREGLRSS